MASQPATATVGRRLTVTGQVQGVGFRPFVYRLALARGLAGWVRNDLGEVTVQVEGPPEAVDGFATALVDEAPPLARPAIATSEACAPESFEGFEIRASRADAEASIHVPADQFACDDCLAEMRDRADRRHGYPFINCTQCGPRYTLIAAMPYDRPNTSMARFPLCAACESEYRDPLDRRFHAEPVACPVCGPAIWLVADGEETRGAPSDVLDAACRLLGKGKIVAARGVGGYHLLCDATSEQAVATLRARKHRPDKPLAVMFPEAGDDRLAAVRRYADPDAAQAALVAGPGRPIVLMRKRDGTPLAANVAPGLDELGVFLPYSPLHALLLDRMQAPLVATSGNISGEPVLTGVDETSARLAGVADAFLHHDRPILRPADDPVYRTVGAAPRPIRLGRGNAPLEMELPVEMPSPVLGVGAHMKNTVALAWGRRLVVSPHIGEMGTPRAEQVFTTLVRDLQSLYSVTAVTAVHDAHPGYTTSRWARGSGLATYPVQHHRAHASAAALDSGLDETAIAVCWDGVGLGDDGRLWGGETFVGRPGAWQRRATLRPFRLVGGERAGREPWRSALGLAWETGAGYAPPAGADEALLRHAFEEGLNTHWTTAAGRLFDAAAALVLGIETCSFEAQGPMALEAAFEETARRIDLPLSGGTDGVAELDWAPLLPVLADASLAPGERSGIFHASLADALARLAAGLAEEAGTRHVLLTGGVFQNRHLARLAVQALEARGLAAHLAGRLPCNDAAISAGQVMEYAAVSRRGDADIG